MGAYDEDTCTEPSSRHTSACACSGKSASCQLWTPSTPSTQPLEPHALGDLHDPLVERPGIELEAAPALRLERAQQALRLEVRNRLVRHAPQLLAGARPLAELGSQRAHSGQVLLGFHAALLL